MGKHISIAMLAILLVGTPVITFGDGKLDARQRQMEQLQAEITKELLKYQKYPRKTFVGAQVKDPAVAEYLDQVLQKIERISNCPYPEQLSEKHLLGRVLVSIQINSDGHLELVEIKIPSDEKLLNETAIALIRKSSPFPRFSPQLLKTTDVLVISRHVEFLKASDDVEDEEWSKNHPCKDEITSSVKTK